MENELCIFCVIFNQFLAHSRSEKINLVRGGGVMVLGGFYKPVKGLPAQAVKFIILISNALELFHVKSLPI